MKVSSLIIAAVATLASAAPIRIGVITVTRVGPPGSGPLSRYSTFNRAFTAIRFGHPAATARLNQTTPVSNDAPPVHRGCAHHLRVKAIMTSNRLRLALGLPLISADETHTSPQPGRVSLPFPPPVRMHTVYPEGGMQDKLFADRLYRAMNDLGPWEGRAVAFVLGCGLGVLVRMVFVLAVLLFRARKSRSAPAIKLPEDSAVSPPEYSVDEKHAFLVAEGLAQKYTAEGAVQAGEKA